MARYILRREPDIESDHDHLHVELSDSTDKIGDVLELMAAFLKASGFVWVDGLEYKTKEDTEEATRISPC